MNTFNIPHDALVGHTYNGEFHTGITPLGSGKNQRRANQADCDESWELLFKKQQDILDQIIAFWKAQKGAYEAFYWVDPAGVMQIVTMDDQIKVGPVIFGYGTVKLTFKKDFNTDSTPPSVSTVTPSNGTTGVDADTIVVWEMSEAIMPEDVNDEHFHVVDSTNGATKAGTLLLSGAGTIVTFTPLTNFTVGRMYLPRVEAGVRDLHANQMVAAYGSRFTIAP